MYSYLQKSILNDGPVDFLEFGVADGASLRSWCGLNLHPSSQFFGFDSFIGLPEDWSPTHPKGTFDRNGVPPEIDDPRVRFCVGWFQDSLPPFIESYEPSNRVVIHNDSDLYSSTLYTLTMTQKFISNDTIIIFDEFFGVLHEYKAFVDYSVAYGKHFKIVAATKGFDQVAVMPAG
jgi:hypothetical protein